MVRPPTVAAVWPATLSSGPESGLVNQLFALMGYCIIAWRRHAALILPNFTSHDHGGTKCEPMAAPAPAPPGWLTRAWCGRMVRAASHSSRS